MADVRILKTEDLKELRLLEEEIFSDPWSENALADWASSNFSLGCVAEEDGRVICYAIGNLVAEEAELFRIGCSPQFRRKGLGDVTLRFFLDAAKQRGGRNVFLEVREHNLAARTLYEKNGFSLLGTRRLYYKNPDEDAVLYQKTIQAKEETE